MATMVAPEDKDDYNCLQAERTFAESYYDILKTKYNNREISYELLEDMNYYVHEESLLYLLMPIAALLMANISPSM